MQLIVAVSLNSTDSLSCPPQIRECIEPSGVHGPSGSGSRMTRYRRRRVARWPDAPEQTSVAIERCCTSGCKAVKAHSKQGP